MTKTNNKNQTEEEKVIKSIRRNWVKIFGIIAVIQFIVLIGMTFVNVEANMYNQILLGLAGLGLFVTAVNINLVRKTIGLDFAIKLMKLKRLKKKGYGMFKEFTLAGRPIYHIVKFSDLIRYKTKYNGEDKNGLILYNPYAKYYDFGANIPIIEGSINDISPKNFFTGNRIGVVPDLAEKIIVETGISQKDFEDIKKQRRWLVWFIIGIAVACIISFDLFAQRLAEANMASLQCYKELGRSAVIEAVTK